MTSNDNEDPTVPSGKIPDGPGPEDRTLPSGSGYGGASEDATMPSGNANGGSEDPTIASAGSSDGKSPSESPASGAVYNPGELMGKTIGGCRVDKLLGRGAMGAVYKARQLKLDRDVAVKVIRPEMMTDPRMLKRFQVEARTVGKFNSANVVMVHDVGFEHGVHYLVMEFVKGKNLREHVKLLGGGRLPAGEALPLIRQACKGLEEARRLNVVHRDIKPDNLMLTEQGILKIADFGIAKPEEDFSMTLTSELIGTPLYMSPEQCQGGADVDFRSDMYSLGATFFYLLTGEPPIRASSVYELIQTKTKLENLCLWKSLPELDENHPLSQVIERMTANDREDRYESYEDLLNDLVLVEAGETITVRAKRIKKEAQDKAASFAEPDDARSPVMMILLVLLVLGGGGGGYYWWSTQQSKQVEPVGPSGEKQKAFQELRNRVGRDGPSQSLRDDLAAISLTGALDASRNALLQDVDDGLAIAAELKKLAAPTSPVIPFDDVANHFAAVVKASAGAEKLDRDVAAWVRNLAKATKAEQVVGDNAVLALSRAFLDWTKKAGAAKQQGLKDSLPELGSELASIEAARVKLRDELPSHRQKLDADVSSTDLDEARKSLNWEPNKSDGSVVVAELEKLEKAFPQTGPSKSLSDALEGLSSTDEEVNKRLVRFVNRVDAARLARDSARGFPPPARAIAPQFDEVDAYLKAIASALNGLRVDGEFPQWAGVLYAELRAEKKWEKRLVDACEDLSKQWDRARLDKSIDLPTLALKMADVDTAVRRAVEVLPGCAAALKDRLPPEQRTAKMTAVRAERAVGDWLAKLADAKGTLRDVDSLERWRREKAGLLATRDALGEAKAALEASAQRDADLKRFAEDCDAWAKTEKSLATAAEQFARGELKACSSTAGIAIVAGRAVDEFSGINKSADHCLSAFKELDDSLAFDDAERFFGMANTIAMESRLPRAVAGKIAEWQSGLGKLKGAAEGMVAIPGTGSVKAFFISGTECRNSEFKQFQGEVAAKLKKGGVAAVRELVPGITMKQAEIEDLINASTGGSGDDNKPVERVRWTEARAFCRRHGKNLPTKAEWMLAAYGKSPKSTYSWGNDWSDNEEQRNPFSQSVAVDAGGISSQFLQLRHMSGNVAEWLAEQKNGAAQVAGGRYTQGNKTSAREQASGPDYDDFLIDDRTKGVGFRAVLRPKDFSGLSWPR